MKTHACEMELAKLSLELCQCEACPRLVDFRRRVAEQKRRAYQAETYWGKPVPGFGDPRAALVLVGLAPGAHGANRTGRMFTGDGSGDFLYAALHRAGLASQPQSTSRSDGLLLSGVYITAACRCVPPDNLPDASELLACRAWLDRELLLLREARVYLALGKIGYDAVAALSRARTHDSAAAPLRLPPFSHGVRAGIPALIAPSSPSAPRGTATLMGSFHVSRQNTQTKRLTPEMFDAVLTDAARLAGLA